MGDGLGVRSRIGSQKFEDNFYGEVKGRCKLGG